MIHRALKKIKVSAYMGFSWGITIDDIRGKLFSTEWQPLLELKRLELFFVIYRCSLFFVTFYFRSLLNLRRIIDKINPEKQLYPLQRQKSESHSRLNFPLNMTVDIFQYSGSELLKKNTQNSICS